MKQLKSIVVITVILVGIASCHSSKLVHKETDAKTASINTYTAPQINTPDEAIAEIKTGNDQHVNHKVINTNIKEMIEHTSDDQHPFAAVLGCIDSRIPAEMVFDQGIGNMFVARVAGNVEDAYILGALNMQLK